MPLRSNSMVSAADFNPSIARFPTSWAWYSGMVSFIYMRRLVFPAGISKTWSVPTKLSDLVTDKMGIKEGTKFPESFDLFFSLILTNSTLVKGANTGL